MKVILIGFMSSGKSTVAPIIAEKLGYQLAEMDAEIIQRSGFDSISEIFEKKGEPYFRELESQVAARYRDASNIVISTGGGTPGRSENMAALRAGQSFTVYLSVDFETIKARIGDLSQRPLFKDGQSAANLYLARQEMYSSYADITITNTDAPQIVADKIIASMPSTQPSRIHNHCVVIGDPVTHSLSPRMHTAGYRALGIDKDFYFDHKQVSSDELPQFVSQFRSPPFRGAACTMPHKEKLVALVDWIDPLAKKIGAINTLVSEDGSVKGFNTDWLGVVTPLRNFGEIGGKKVLILGAGGAARAAIVGLTESGAHVTVTNRTMEKTQAFANQFSIAALAWDKRLSPNDWDIIINTTSLGMHPRVTDSPLEGYKFSAEQIVFETIYHPAETQLLKDARAAGARTIEGKEMLLIQGAAQFKLFTGKDAPLQAMRQALDDN